MIRILKSTCIIFFILIIIPVLLLFSGCSDAADDVAEESTPESISEPTNEPIPETTPEPTPAPEPNPEPTAGTVPVEFHLSEYIIRIDKAERTPVSVTNAIGLSSQDSKGFVVFVSYISDSKGIGGVHVDDLSAALKESNNKIKIETSNGEIYELYQISHSSGITFENGVFSSPSIIPEFKFEFLIPADVNIEDSSLIIEGQVIPLKYFTE